MGVVEEIDKIINDECLQAYQDFLRSLAEDTAHFDPIPPDWSLREKYGCSLPQSE